jgi:hypothetical protein
MRVILAPCVWFWHSGLDFGTLGWILALWVGFWHSDCDLNNHACDFHTHECDLYTHACDFDTLRVKLLYYNININLSCRHMRTFFLHNPRFWSRSAPVVNDESSDFINQRWKIDVNSSCLLGHGVIWIIKLVSTR